MEREEAVRLMNLWKSGWDEGDDLPSKNALNFHDPRTAEWVGSRVDRLRYTLMAKSAQSAMKMNRDTT